MEKKNKFIVGSFIGILCLLGIFSVVISKNKIEVSFPSEMCGTSMLRVTKDDFTLKCGSRIAFQADTVVDYYKTYGVDEWVRNNRYVGVNKKDITLWLEEVDETSFKIVRETRYRKGKQYLLDGTLKEIYTFTDGKVKINYEYLVENSAKHRITMRIKKQYKSYLDAFDPFGYTGILTDDSLYYEGEGNLFIDPSISLYAPSAATESYNEGETIPFVCNVTIAEYETAANVTFFWNALNGTYSQNGSVDITSTNGTEAVTFSRVVPHLMSNDTGNFEWNCYVCNSSNTCQFNETNGTVEAMYKPHDFNIFSPDSVDTNFLNGSNWGLNVSHPQYTNLSSNNSIYLNWTYMGHPDVNGNITWNLSYVGTLNTTRKYDYFQYDKDNATNHADWTISSLPVDDYYITVEACTTENLSLCVNDTISNPIEIFDYSISIASAADKIRYSTASSATKAAAYGQTDAEGIIKIDWLGNSYPDGAVNVSIKIDNTTDMSCATIYFNETGNNPTTVGTLVYDTKVMTIRNATSDPQYIWLWATKDSCGTTTISHTYSIEALT